MSSVATSLGPSRSLEAPTLAAAAKAALEVLSVDDDGFFLVVELGNLVLANHANNHSRMVACTADLDEAVRAVVSFVDRLNDALDWNNTLVLVTSDHANSYLRLTDRLKLGAGDLPRSERSRLQLDLCLP